LELKAKESKRMKLSAALIVRNEEYTLERCLQSIKNEVDEIIIVDTGSSDRTREIAGRYTDHVYDFEWRKDFAAARKFSFAQATGDWVFWVDADDVVLNSAKIRNSLLDAAPEINGFYWKYVVGQDRYGNSTCELWRERCVRNDGSFQWVGRVHEVLVSVKTCQMLRNNDVTVLHLPHVPGRLRDPHRNLEILKEEYELNRLKPEPRLLLYLGNEYAGLGELKLALEFLERYCQVANWDEEKYLCELKIADIFRRLNKYQEAIDVALHALKTCPHWPNAYFSIGETYYFLKDWTKVIQWMECGKRLPVPDTLCIVNPMEYKYSWIIYYTNALYYTKRLPEALEWSREALAICPHETWHLSNVSFFSNHRI
jgi:glycosyltransferase involved in cell wall biosynthesis